MFLWLLANDEAWRQAARKGKEKSSARRLKDEVNSSAFYDKASLFNPTHGKGYEPAALQSIRSL